MTEYKTLDELRKENGEKPIKIMLEDESEDYWIIVTSKMPDDDYCCYTKGCRITRLPPEQSCKLYQEPKKKVEHWNAICKHPENNCYYITTNLYALEKRAKKDCLSSFIQLDKSRPSIMLYPVEEEE